MKKRKAASQRKPETMCYAARLPGEDGYFAVCIDDPEYANSTAKTVAGWLGRGATVERVTFGVAKAGILKWLPRVDAADRR